MESEPTAEELLALRRLAGLSVPPDKGSVMEPTKVAERWVALVEIAGRDWQDACDCGQSTHKVRGGRCAVWAYEEDISKAKHEVAMLGMDAEAALAAAGGLLALAAVQKPLHAEWCGQGEQEWIHSAFCELLTDAIAPLMALEPKEGT